MNEELKTNQDKPNQDLLKYINDCMDQGISEDELKETLINTGWSEEDIEKGLKEVSETNKEKKIKSPEKPEKAKEALKNHSEEMIDLITKKVVGDKELEKDLSGGEDIEGTKEIDEKRDHVVEEGVDDIEKIVKSTENDLETEKEIKQKYATEIFDDKESDEEESNKEKDIELINSLKKELKDLIRERELREKNGESGDKIDELDFEIQKLEEKIEAYDTNKEKDIELINNLKKELKDLIRERELREKNGESGDKIDELDFEIQKLEEKIEAYDINKEKDKEEKEDNENEKEKDKEEKEDNENEKEKDKEEKEDNENEKEKEDDKEGEKYKYDQEIIDAFAEFNITEKDLDSIEGFKDISPGAQFLIAKQIKVMALDSAKLDVSSKQQELFKGKKSKISKFGAAVKGWWKKSKWEQEAKLEQKEAGIDKHKGNLENLVILLSKMDIKGEIVNGEQKFDFIDIENKIKDNPEKKEDYRGFNWAANEWAKVSESYNEKYASSKQKKAYKEAYERYNKAKEKILKGEDTEMAQKVNDIDLQISVLKTLKDSPEINDDWKKMSRGKFKRFFSGFGQADKVGYFAAGMGARLLFASGFGTIAAVPTIAAVGALRSRHMARKEFRGLDQDKSRKEHLKNHPLFTARRKAYENLQEFYKNEKYELDKDGKEIIPLNKRGERVISEELKSNQDYIKALEQFKKIDQSFKDLSEKSIDKKTELADSMGSKLENLVKKYEDEEKPEKKLDILRMINNRLDFSKEKLANDLVNFGKEEQKTKNMLDFYQTLGRAQMLAVTELEKYGPDVLKEMSYFRENEKGEMEEVNMNKRVEAALDQYEEITEQKLSKNRREAMRKKMKKGALIAGSLALAGGALAEGADFFKLDGVAFSPGADAGDEVLQGAAVGTASETIAEEVVEESKEAVSRSFEELKELGALTKEISNENLKPGQTDSIWRSARELFMRNAEDLGYEGDVSNTTELRAWADNMTGNAINRMDDVKDKVFEGIKGPDGERGLGNLISIDKNEAGEFVISVEQGESYAPGYLPETPDNADQVISETADTINEIPKKEFEGFDIKPSSKDIGGTEAENLNNFDKIGETEEVGSGLEEVSGSSAEESAEEILKSSSENLDKVEELDSGGLVDKAEPQEGPPDIKDDFDKIVGQHTEAKNTLSLENTLNQIAEKSELDTKDKVLLEFFNQNKDINTEKPLTQILSENVRLFMQMNNPDNSLLLQFYELRHAANSEEQVNILHGLLDDSLKESLDESQLSLYENLKELDAFNISENSNPAAREIVFKIGEESQNFDLSENGLKDLSNFVKNIVSDPAESAPMEEVSDLASQEAVASGVGEKVIENQDPGVNDYQENTNVKQFEDQDGNLVTKTSIDSSVNINSPDFIRETREMTSNLIKIFTEEARRIPSNEFFENPNEIYAIRGLGRTSFAEQFENATGFNFDDLDPIDKRGIANQFRDLNNTPNNNYRSIERVLNARLNLIRSKYNNF